MDNRIQKLQTWTILFLSFIVSFFLCIYVARHVNEIEDIIRSIGILGPLFSILLYAVLSATPIPSDPLSVINGAIFGPIMGSFISWMGNNLAAVVEYYIGHGLGSVSDFDNQKHKLPFNLGRFPADSPYFLILGRFVPQYGGKIVSFLGGIYKVPLRRYLWTSAIANLVGSIAFALLGYGLIHLL